MKPKMLSLATRNATKTFNISLCGNSDFCGNGFVVVDNGTGSSSFTKGALVLRIGSCQIVYRDS